MKSHIALLRLALVLVLATAAGSCAGTTPPDKGAQPQEEVMKDAEGAWEGTNTLWLKYPEDPQESAAKMVVSPGRVEYSWAYQDEPQTGTFVFSGSGGQLTAQWTDTWHAKDSMACSGTEEDGVVIVTGTYPAGDGPDWSWRTEFRLDAPDKLNVKMYNILPDSLLPDQVERELLAVNMDLTRAPSQ